MAVLSGVKDSRSGKELARMVLERDSFVGPEGGLLGEPEGELLAEALTEALGVDLAHLADSALRGGVLPLGISIVVSSCVNFKVTSIEWGSGMVDGGEI